MLASAVVGNLVRWGNGREGDVGVVADRSADGHQVTVRFDSGETHNFVVPSATLDRLIFPDGHHLSVRNDGRTGWSSVSFRTKVSRSTGCRFQTGRSRPSRKTASVPRGSPTRSRSCARVN